MKNPIDRNNPFYNNYIFHEIDIERLYQRSKLNFIQRFFMWFRPAYVCINDGYAFHFKVMSDGAIYMTRAERLKCFRCNDGGCPACDGTKGDKHNPEPY